MKTSITRRVFVKRSSGAAVATVLGMHLLHDIAYGVIDQADSRPCYCFSFNPPAGTEVKVTLTEGMGWEAVQKALKDAGATMGPPVACTAGNENKTTAMPKRAVPMSNPPAMELTFINRPDGSNHFLCAKSPLKIDGTSFE